MELIDKEVYFCDWCSLCKHADKADPEDPCAECLDNPVNQYSHKPVKYEPKES